MMTNELNVKSVDGAVFRDEIFQWPIAKLTNDDVWAIIFDNYVTNPADKANLLLASPQFFGPRLEKEKCSILFGQVAHILHKNNYLDISNKRLLKYRCLSKSCKLSLDKSLKTTTPCFVNLEGIDHDKNDPRHYCWEYLKPSERTIDEIISRSSLVNSSPDGSSPLVNGSIKISSGTPSNLRIKIQSFLSTFGSQIYNFRFFLEGVYPNEPPHYEQLCNYLSMMPNLKSLELEQLWQTIKGVVDFSLPDLKHLEVLKLKGLPPWAVKTLLQKYGPKLKKLAFNDFFVDMDQLKFADSLSDASHLEQLSLPPIRDHMSVEVFLESNVKCPLSLTAITMSAYLKPKSSRKFKELTTALGKLFENNNGRLHTLNLSICCEQRVFSEDSCNSFDDYDSEYDDQEGYDRDIKLMHTARFISKNDLLMLPSLKRLWIYGDHVSFHSMDFILGLQDSLEELVLNLNNCIPKKRSRNQQIQFFGYWHKMEKSNVWEMMPKMQKITIRWSNGVGSYYEDWTPSNCLVYVRSRSPIPAV